MGNYRLKELQNLKKEKSNVIYQVNSKLSTPPKGIKFTNVFISTIISVSIIILIINIVMSNSNKLNTVFKEHLVEINGEGVAYSELFKDIDGQSARKLNYYEPITFEKFKEITNFKLPDNSLHLNELESQVILVESLQGFETQLTFSKKDEYGMDTEFLSISISQSEINPFNIYDFSNLEDDGLGNSIRLEPLIDSVDLVHQVRKLPSGLAFNYYSYSHQKNKIILSVTQANELYTYYNGVIYHIGYDLKQSNEDVVNFVRELILLNTELLTYYRSN